MEERFLHFFMAISIFLTSHWLVKGVRRLFVITPGNVNTNSGPDFLEAKIQVDGIVWAGSVEIHVKASEWFNHNHHTDAAYENTILHVVWDADKAIQRMDGSAIPTFSLKNKVNPSIYDRYRKLVKSPEKIPCANRLMEIDRLVKVNCLDKVLMERLLTKSTFLISIVSELSGDWEEASYQLLAKNLGYKVNADQMFRLSKSTPLKILSKMSSLKQIEALLFGQAGLLGVDEMDEYGEGLKQEYHFLSHKYSLSPKITAHEWRFMRMRPANFPTIRIAQLSQIVFRFKHIFSTIIETTKYSELNTKLMVEQSDYWKTHYRFSYPTDRKISKLGKTSAENIIMNTVVPILVAYGKFIDDQNLIDRAVSYLQQIPAENNKLTRMWDSLGWTVESAFDSQSLIELYNSYCQRKRCISCNIGMSLIKS